MKKERRMVAEETLTKFSDSVVEQTGVLTEPVVLKDHEGLWRVLVARS